MGREGEGEEGEREVRGEEGGKVEVGGVVSWLVVGEAGGVYMKDEGTLRMPHIT